MKMKFCRSIGKALKKEIHLTSAILFSLTGNGTRNGNLYVKCLEEFLRGLRSICNMKRKLQCTYHSTQFGY